ncbi:MAG TPA: alpha/beta fold hydrolase, partial [Myxococcota bacterium]|nr:alpha/beta fold hydrolase [Myxococcota bacterium]
MWLQEWGAGDPIIALHPLALESTAFAGVARLLAQRGLRTIAVDLPGFGRTPGPDGTLTPARMAEPVMELAAGLEPRPLLLGMSMGGRVALEVAFVAPSIVRGVVLVAPYLPWRSSRWLLALARLMSPSSVERVPLQHAWPLLRHISAALERRRELEHDWLARASARVGYYLSCPATRAHFISAARELALDPAYGSQGTWTRLSRLSVPAAFVWGGQDRLIPPEHAQAVAALLPRAHHVSVPCCGHFMNGRHYRCFETAMAEAVLRTIDPGARPRPA